MALLMNICFLFLYLVLVFSLADSRCPKTFDCGELGPLEFPLTDAKDPGCGVLLINGCDSDDQRIQLAPEGRWYDIVRKELKNSFVIRDREIERLLYNRNCFTFTNVSLPVSPLTSFRVLPNITFYTCWNGPNDQELLVNYKPYFIKNDCPPVTVFYQNTTAGATAPPVGISMPPQCTLRQVAMHPSNRDLDSTDLFNLVASEFIIEWHASEACSKCHSEGGQCLTDSKNQFVCKKEDGIKKWKLALAISGAGLSLILLCLFVSYVIWQRKKMTNGDYLMSGKLSSSLSSRSDSKGGSFYYNIPIFSYTELEEATNNFDPYKELGDGGFGTVYYGKLQDGREVAIKRLYEHNFRRVEQFLNEIKILTALRHPNLVSLYGCTSRRSRELLLVYEYISNGTVADHIHGVRAKEALLTWPIRMRIAVETATALAYLHRSDIIHRDVKTYNILLDSNFSVKVADFGLSRLFPDNVTHISTAPQGTPGYVDPDYHQSYQLTDKSDVYSFGVVLIELISSMPAVDITRHRHEINLSNLAVDRIQRHAYDELIDSSLGYGSDPKVTKMTTSVAELAFSCLQLDKDSRPSMDEVVDFLKDIEGGEDCNFEKIKGVSGNQTLPGKIPPSPEADDVFLLKNENFQTSPTSVIGRWASSSTTTSSIE